MTNSNFEEIAVIGLACRFPGAKTPDEYWKNLQEGKNSIRHFSDAELLQAGIDPLTINNSNYIKARGVINDIERFDPKFFGITPYEATITDPQQRILLEIAWEALESAGYVADKSDESIGIFAGMSENAYLHGWLLKNNDFLKNYQPYQAALANDAHFLTTKVSYLLNLKGPSINVSTACSTSLVAIVEACQALQQQNCGIALAGGVAIQVPQVAGYFYQDGYIFSNDGLCRAFDAAASGTVNSNGAGIVVLKRLSDAIRDKDNIRAVIKSFAINNDGANKAGYTAPSVTQQSRCIEAALAKLDNAESVTYIESHGTATILGDPIEVAALTKAFRRYTNKKVFCAIGSVKTNIGHTDVAAGVAGFIKSILCLENKAIPASLYFNKPNPHIAFTDSPFYVNTAYKKWDIGEYPLRRAGVSSFGIGGTNAHVILEEAPVKAQSNRTKPNYALLLSAKTPTALAQQENQLLDYIGSHKNNNASLAEIAYTLAVGRKEFNCRKAYICSDLEGAKELLRRRSSQDIIQNHGLTINEKKIVFLFSGQGTGYAGMAKDLYQHNAIFRQCIDICCNYLDSDIAQSLLVYLTDPQSQGTPAVDELALFIVEYALAQTLIDYGIKPTALLGHSLGEYVAACVAGVFSLQDAIKLMQGRSKLIASLPAGMMISIPLNVSEVKKKIKNEELAIAAINSATSCVISGAVPIVTKWQQIFDKELESSKQKCTVLNIPYAFHAKEVEVILAEYGELLDTITFNPPKIPYLSNITGSWITAEQIADKSYFESHIRNTVLFADSASLLINEGFQSFYELGPGQVLSALICQQQGESKQLLISSVLPNEKEFKTEATNQLIYFNRALAKHWVHHGVIDWSANFQGDDVYRASLPTYPFERMRCWLEPSPQITAETKPMIYESRWEVSSLAVLDKIDKQNTWLIFVDEHGVAKQLIAKLKEQGQDVIYVNKGKVFRQVSEDAYRINPENKQHYFRLIEMLNNKGQLPFQIVHCWSLTKASPNDVSPSTEKIQTDSFFSLVWLAQATFRYILSAPFYLTVVTNHFKAAVADEKIIAEKAVLLGPCLVIPQESHALCRIIDTDILDVVKAKHNRRIKTILDELSVRPTDSLILHRNGLRLINHFKESISSKAPSNNGYLRKQGLYVITGGTGKIGIELAEFLASYYKANIILITRTELPDEALWENQDVSSEYKNICRRLNSIKKTANSLKVFHADVSNYEQMRAVFTKIKTTYLKKDGHKIDGIFHLAAVTKGAAKTLVKDLNKEQAYEQFFPKIQGTQVIEKLLHDFPVKFCVLYSSLANIVGGLGLCSYASANAYLDSFAESSQNKNGTHWISINWEVWDFKSDNMVEKDFNWPFHALDSFQGLRLLDQCLQGPNLSRYIVSTTDLKTRIAEWVNYRMLDTKGCILQPSVESNTSLIAQHNCHDIEAILKQLFEECLGLSDIDIYQDFYELGGDSLSILRLFEMVNQAFPQQLKLADLVRHRSVYHLSKILRGQPVTNNYSFLVKLKLSGNNQPIFLFHPIGGTVLGYLELAKHLPENHPCYGIQEPSAETNKIQYSSIEEMAHHYLQSITKIQPQGPYLLGGYSFGATLAFEVAKQLESQDQEAIIFLIDGWAKFSEDMRKETLLSDVMQKVLDEARVRMQKYYDKERCLEMLRQRMDLLLDYSPPIIKSQIVLFKAKDILAEYEAVDDITNHWQRYVINKIQVHPIDGDHITILKGRSAQQIGNIMCRYTTTDIETI